MKKKSVLVSVSFLSAMLIMDSAFNTDTNIVQAAVNFKDLPQKAQEVLSEKKTQYSQGDTTKSFVLDMSDGKFFVIESADNIPDGSYGIKYSYNDPLKNQKTQYGEGDKEKYFLWKKDDKGNLKFEASSIPPQESEGITYKYSSKADETSHTHERVDNSSGSSLGDIEGDIKNKTSQEGEAGGGAILNANNGSIGNINGNFIENYVENIKSESESVTAYGGAIYNYQHSTIDNIIGDFIGNHVKAVGAVGNVYGGAIYNYGSSTIGNITGDFIGNYIEAELYGGSSYVYGGAIYNDGMSNIGNIEGNFIGNYLEVSNQINNYTLRAMGGAVYNSSTGGIGNITGNFIGNHIDINENNIGSVQAQGGAIYNSSSGGIGNITGNFIGNYVISKGTNGSAMGGAIMNYSGSISEDGITGNFINNYVYSEYGSSQGGAIANQGSGIAANGTITGDFIGNYAINEKGYAQGGAIYVNYGNTGGKGIEGNFINNFVYSEDSYAQGGAISGTVAQNGIMKSDFVNNYAYSKNSYAQGGAIYSQSGYIAVNGLEGNFIGNYVISDGNYAKGGALCVSGGIASNGAITSDFIGNYAISNGNNSYASGGAIDSGYGGMYGRLGFNGDFIGNYAAAYGENSYSQGGAIHSNSGQFVTNGVMESDFIFNSAYSKYSYSQGGAVWNGTSFGSEIIGDYLYNSAISDGGYSQGGAVFNSGGFAASSSSNVTSNFIGNSAVSKGDNGYSQGGALFNGGAVAALGFTGDFNENYAAAYGENAYAQGGAVYNAGGFTTNGTINSNFSDNTAYSEKSYAQGGAIYNSASMSGKINANFTNNKAYSAQSYAYGGAVCNEGGQFGINGLVSQFINNSAIAVEGDAYGGAIYTKQGNVGVYSFDSDFSGNLAYTKNGNAFGGAIYHDNTSMGRDGGITGNYINNAAISENGDALGGAIYSDTTTTGYGFGEFKNSSFIGNRAIAGQGKTAHGGAIYLKNGEINISADGDTVFISDNYVQKNGNEKDNEAIFVEAGSVNFKAVNNGKLKINDKINGSDVYNLTFNSDNTGVADIGNDIINADIQNSNITMNVSEGRFLNNNNSLTLNNSVLNIGYTDVNNINFNNLTIEDGTINIDRADADLQTKQMGRVSADVYNVEGAKITINDVRVLNDAKNAVTPILFADSDLKENVESNAFEALAPIYKYAITYSNDGTYGDGGYMVFSRKEVNPAVMASPVAQQLGGYAAMSQALDYSFEFADKFSDLPSKTFAAMKNANKYAINEAESTKYINNEINNNGLWVRPYTSFENVPLKNGYRVNTINYGTIIGGDTNLMELKNGWNAAYTGYVGYNGSNQHYSGIHTNQNGGILGTSATFNKGKFFTALSLATGANIGNSDTMYGSENFTMLMAGAASKSMYNLEFAEGKFIIQPSFLIGYTFVNTFDYKNAAGVNIKSDPLHAIQLRPNIKLVQNTKNGWQPYLSAGMVYNIMDKTQVYANEIELPSLSIKPYVEYGLGVSKQYKDKYTGYLQAMARNGGRRGIALSFGLRYALDDNVFKGIKKKTDVLYTPSAIEKL